jgi:hypothetical protein
MQIDFLSAVLLPPSSGLKNEPRNQPGEASGKQSQRSGCWLPGLFFGPEDRDGTSIRIAGRLLSKYTVSDRGR